MQNSGFINSVTEQGQRPESEVPVCANLCDETVSNYLSKLAHP